MRPRHAALEEHDRALGLLPVVERCMFCTWVWQGTAVEGRERALQHRLDTHPEVNPPSRRNVRNLRNFRRAALKDGDVDEINAERHARARLTGVDLSGEAA